MDFMESIDVPAEVGMSSLFYIVIVLLSIGFAWWALQSFRFDLFLKNPKGSQAKALQIFLSIALGYEIAKFLIDYSHWSLLLKWMF